MLEITVKKLAPVRARHAPNLSYVNFKGGLRFHIVIAHVLE